MEMREAYGELDGRDLADEVFSNFESTLHNVAVDKGFYDSLDMSEFNSQAKQLMMITSEVVEVMEVLRKDKGNQELLYELADIYIRLFDFTEALRRAGVLEGSVAEAIHEKTQINTRRARMHGVRG